MTPNHDPDTGSRSESRLAFWVSRAAAALFFVLLVSSPAFAHQDIERRIAAITCDILSEPGEAALFLQRCDLYRLHHEFKLAQADLARAARLGPDSAALELARARLLRDMGSPLAAKKALDRLLTIAPCQLEALELRAEVNARRGRYADALDDYTRAINCSERPEPHLFIGRARATAHLRPNGLERALRGLEEGVRCLGSVPSLELYAIELEARSGRHDAALRRIERISRSSKRQERWHAMRGDILMDAGRRFEARQAFDLALESIELLPQKQRRSSVIVQLHARIKGRIGELDSESGTRRAPDSPTTE